MKRAAIALVLCLSACATDADHTLGIADPRARLHVESAPQGATASVVYGSAAEPVTISCTTPCDLSVPVIKPFRLNVHRDGYTLTSPLPAMTWKRTLFDWVVDPANVTAQMQPSR